MKKYLYNFVLILKSSFHYRFNTVMGLFFENINILITIIFWILIFKSSSSKILRSYNINDIITYFVIGSIFRKFIITDSGWTYLFRIKNGMLSSQLLRPYNISIMTYCNNLSETITKVIPNILFVLAVSPFIAVYLTWNMSMVNFLFIILFLIISTITSHLVWSMLGYLSFWTEESNAIMWSFMVLFNLVSGMFIPLDFFPGWGVKILEVLPTSAWGYLPVKIYLGKCAFMELLFLLIVHVLWCLVLILLQKLLWTKGTRKYSSIGG
jgi:ABC-2 type transport system permease protein